MAKTAQQLQQEEEERKQREAEAVRQQQQQQQNAFNLGDLLNPGKWFNSIGDLFGSFGTIFTGLLVITGLYFVGQTEWGRDLLGRVMDRDKVDGFFNKGNLLIAGLLDKIGMHGMLDKTIEGMDEAQIKALLSEQGMNEATIAILAPTKEVFLGNLHFIKENGGSLTNPINADVIYGFLTKKPELLGPLVAANAGSGALSDKQKAFADKLIGSVQTIVKDGRIDGLLAASNPNRATYLAVLQSQFPNLPPDKLAALIDQVGFGPDGKLTEPFRTLLGNALTLDPAKRATALDAFIATPGLAAKASVIADIAAVAAETPQKQALVKQLGAEGMSALLHLREAGVQVEQELNLVKTGGAPAILNELLDNDALRATLLEKDKHRLHDIGVLLEKAMPASTPQEKQMRNFLTTKPANGSDNYVNIGALVTLVDAIDKKGDAERNKAVLGQVVSLLAAQTQQEKKAAIGALNAEQLAAFMKDHSQAFGTFLGQMNNHFLAPDQQRLIQGLRENWGDQTIGIAEVLSDTKAVQFFLKKISEGSSITLSDAMISAGLKWEGGKVAENSKDIMDLMHALHPSPTPARAARPAATSRNS